MRLNGILIATSLLLLPGTPTAVAADPVLVQDKEYPQISYRPD
jgi:hypothetical protein